MNSQRHTDDEHHTYGVRGLMATIPDCASGDAGSIPVAHPIFTERFMRLAGYILGEHSRFSLGSSGVELLVEAQGVAGSIPSRGTVKKYKL